MPSLNLVQVIGHVGKDPELRYSPSGTAITTFSVAANRSWKSREDADKWEEEVTWFNVVAFANTAERAAEALRKGNLVYVSGRIQVREYEKNGETRRTWEVVADRAVSLERKEREGARDTAHDAIAERGRFPQTRPERTDEAPLGEPPDDLDGLPF
jgi:single-strand DNA-binding protein